MWKIQRVVKKGKYLYAVVPEHPKATKNGYVLEHRVVMENHLGRMLEPNEVVHHENEDKHDNRISNLKVMTLSDHSKLHARSPKMISLECDYCGKSFERRRNQRSAVKGYKRSFCSRSCNGKFQAQARLV